MIQSLYTWEKLASNYRRWDESGVASFIHHYK